MIGILRDVTDEESERKSKEEIAEAVCYASPTSIYDQRNKALVRFALLYFGAGAMPSM